jgi:hypothetical protein
MNRVPKSQLLPLIRLGSKAVELLGPLLGKKQGKPPSHSGAARNAPNVE